MARIIIEVESDRIANAIALWFETNDALDSFADSRSGMNLVKAGENCPEDAEVNFDEASRNVTHTITLS